MKDSLKTHKINGEKIQTGNVVFSSVQKKSNKKYILHVSTIKNFSNLQFLGVEMFYEYWNLLNCLDMIAIKKGIKFLVKPHPTVKNCTMELKRNFKNISFSNKSLDTLFQHASAVISYSSSAIEDALNSFLPVVLLDLQDRYVHINSSNQSNHRSAINYVNSENDLIKLIKNLDSKNITNFNEYIYDTNFEHNIENKILPLAKS